MPRPYALKMPFVALFISALLCGPGFAETARENDAWITRDAMRTATGQEIPAGAFGILTIDRPREVTLLDLRGKVGRGTVVLRSDEPETCLTLPVRFVAGDFGGDTVSGHLADPIRLTLKSRRVAKVLARGRDVVSDMYRVSGRPHPDADIVLRSGLEESFGFVINPGRNILGDVFGVELQEITCKPH